MIRMVSSLTRLEPVLQGNLPKGFDPSSLYPARQHPKALQMTVFGMGDALGQLGIDWKNIQEKICS